MKKYLYIPFFQFMCYHFFQTVQRCWTQILNKLCGPEYFMKGTVWYFFWPEGIGKIY